MKKINNHGDLILYPIEDKNPPKNAKKAKIHILQQSSTTGNRHEVVSKKNMISYWKENEKEYIHCSKDYIIQHVGGDEEHGVQNVEAGTREIRHEQEYDPFKNELRRVID